MDFQNDASLQDLFRQANKIGSHRYHRLTEQDLENYRKYDYWRYVDGQIELGTTDKSRQWVRDNSDHQCPVCGDYFSQHKGRTIDHKLPRAQYPWLSLDFRNFWVICYACNQEKGEKHWYEYEHYMFVHHRDRYPDIVLARPRNLLKSLRA